MVIDTPGPATDDFLRRYDKRGMQGRPKYVRLREALRSAVDAGHWLPGARLPSDSDLTRLTGFSLGTVQRALRELADGGVVVRSQGSGTYAAERGGAIDAPLHLRFRGSVDGEPTFLPLYPKVLSRTRAQGSGAWSAWLRPEAGTDIVRIDRQLSVNGEFIVFNRFYFDAHEFPDLATRPLASLDGANLKQLLGEAVSMPISDVEQHVSFVKFDAGACKAMGVKPGTSGLLLESAAAAGRSSPVYFLESFIPPNDRRLDVSALR
ncbi:MAG: GntR family transcriptional regulator [Rubrivivax sp.]|nr:GntR family transcriptional regulator [Rubrivivax sp.]